MPLVDRPDFQSWLLRYQLIHEYKPIPPAAPGGPVRCHGCGAPLDPQGASHAECLVCLAEQYGRQQAEGAARIGRALLIALMEDRRTPVDPIRAEIEDVLADYEDVLERGDDLAELAALVVRSASRRAGAPPDAPLGSLI